MYRYRRRHLKEDTEDLDRWLISYADYMTLMFAVFVMLYALSLVKQDSFRALSESFTAMFSVPSKSSHTEKYLSDAMMENQTNQQMFGEGLLDTRGKKLLEDESQLVNIDAQREGTPLPGLKQKLTESLTPLLDAGVAEISDHDEWLILNLSSNLLFSSGSAYPSSNLDTLVQVISNALASSNNYIRIRGYTDSSPINNELFSSNWLLSATRANAVLEAMYKQGIDGRRLAVEAYGDNFAVAENTTAQGRAQNRRVAVAISKWAAIDGEQPEDIPLEQIESQIVGDDSTNLSQAVDRGEAFDRDGKIRVITLPDGGIRITTLDENTPTGEGEVE